MKELRSLLAEASTIKAELKRLDEMEANARSAIVAATDEDVTTPGAQQRIQDARLTLEVVAARRVKLKSPCSIVNRRLLEGFKAKGREWNARVEEARAAKEKELVAALLPFWLGDEKQMRATMGLTIHHFPIFHAYRVATFSFPFYPNPTEQDLVRDVRLLLEFIERSQKALGLS